MERTSRGRDLDHTAARMGTREKEHLERARTQPFEAEAWTKLGEAYETGGQWELAAAVVQRAIQLDSNQPEPWFVLSRCLGSLQQRDAALEAARRAVELVPGRAESLAELGRRTITSHPHEAIRSLKKAHALKPGNARLLGLLGLVYTFTWEYLPAVEFLERSLRIDPNVELFWTALGSNLVALGRHDAAEGALRSALSLDSRSALAWRCLGRALEHLGRFPEADRALEQARDLGDTRSSPERRGAATRQDPSAAPSSR